MKKNALSIVITLACSAPSGNAPLDAGTYDDAERVADSSADVTPPPPADAGAPPPTCGTATGTRCWYVDSSATGAHDGTSWAMAWLALTDVKGIAPGETVFVSGGKSNESQTYAMKKSWTPLGGSPGSPITYRIGLDADHDGTAFFSGTDIAWLGGINTGPISNVVISGDAGDGKMHFTIADPTTNVSPWQSAVQSRDDENTPMTNTRISYVNFGKIAGLSGYSVVYINMNATKTPLGIEIDHTYGYGTNPQLDIYMHLIFRWSASWDENMKFHDSTIWVPYDTNKSGYGADGIQSGGSGISVYRNLIASYAGGGGVNHQDGWQTLGGTYCKAWGNVIVGMTNYDLYLGATGTGGGFDHWVIFDNFTIGSGGGIVIGAGGANQFFTNLVVANNVVDSIGGMTLNNVNTSSFPGSTFSDDVLANNVVIGGGIDLQGDSSNPTKTNALVSSAQAKSDFVGYVAHTQTSDFHVVSSATALVGQGTNLSSYCSVTPELCIDADGKTRPATGAWDIGAYEQ